MDKNCVYDAIEKAIWEGVEEFLVGNQGRFDRVVYACLRQLREKYPRICFSVVLSRLPEKDSTILDDGDTVFPEVVEMSPPQFAIDRANRWMLQRATLVICYVQHPWGGAYKFADLAARQGKSVRNLGSMQIG